MALRQGFGNYLKCWIHICQLEVMLNSTGHFSKLKGMLKEVGMNRIFPSGIITSLNTSI